MKEESLETRIVKLEQELAAVRSRNQRVEVDKAWEISLARKCTILAITYLTCLIVFALIGVVSPALNALIPTIGYFLSTLTLGMLRKFWVRRYT